MKIIEMLPSFFFLLLTACLISGCAGAMSDVTIPIALESLPELAQGQKPTARIEIIDLRRDSTMRRTAFSASLGEITLSPPESELVKQLVTNAIIRVASDRGVLGELPTVYCGINAFDIVTPATALYWDVTTRIELVLRIRGNERTVSGEAVERTWAWPSAEIIQRVATQALRVVSVAIEQELPKILITTP
jgi:hypothetical protein